MARFFFSQKPSFEINDIYGRTYFTADFSLPFTEGFFSKKLGPSKIGRNFRNTARMVLKIIRNCSPGFGVLRNAKNSISRKFFFRDTLTPFRRFEIWAPKIELEKSKIAKSKKKIEKLL